MQSRLRAGGAIAAAILLLIPTFRARIFAQAAPAVTVTPLTVAAGGMVAVTVANAAGNTTDWVGLYASGASDTAMLDWKYLNGTRTAPATAATAATVTFAVPSAAGVYNVRLFSRDTYVRLATSAAITVQSAGSASVAATPATVTPGGTITASISNGPANALDWVGLYASGSPDAMMIDWKYLNGSRTTPATGSSSANVTFAAPAAAGGYNVRLFAKDTFALIATSATVTVQGAASGAATVTATPSSIAGGATETVTIANGPGNALDWVGLYAAGSGDAAIIDWKYLNGQKAAPPVPVSSATVTFAMPGAAGTYNVRLFSNDSFTKVASSGAVVVQTSSGNIINVPAGGDLQSALNNANPGDTILLAAGATYVGNFVLPAKSGTGVITIRSSAPDSSLPGATARIDPSYSPQLPKLKSTNSSPALITAAGAHHYTLMALEFPATYQGFYDIIRLGDGSAVQNSLAMVPHDLVVDRCYIHGDVTYGQKRGIALNSASTTIANSYIAEIKAVGQDSQAIGGWNGPGPYTIRNNYLEAAGENVLFGGSDPAIPNLIPSDITVQGNTMSKPLAWRTQSWSVKNIFELKNAQRVVVDGNVFEYNWLAAQVGYAVVFTPRNQGGTCPWCNVQQVQFTNNVVRHVSSGINILGTDNLQPSGTLNTITIRNNLFEDVSGSAYGGSGRFMLIGAGAANVTVDHNTVLQDGTSALYGYAASMPGFVFTNNIVPDHSWAIMGDSASPGNGAIAMYFPTGVFKNGIFAGSNPATYPLNNFYPTLYDAVGFVNLTGANYRLASTSPFHNAATDGTDVGCNIDAVNAAAKTKY
jgi:hypothetical protein